MARIPLFATATRGTEALVEQELLSFGCKRTRQDRGGVRFMADPDELARLLIHSRLMMRVMYPLATTEGVVGAEGLYEAAKEIEWENWIHPDTTFAVEATLKDSEHTHSGFVALKVKDAIVDRIREKKGERPSVDSHNPEFSVIVHLSKTTLTISLDVCGDPLFKRGYRVQTTVAPLKETLAAAMVMTCKFTGDEPFADPMCGSGTLIIEAAHIAMKRPAGLKRTFACESWPSFGEMLKPHLANEKKEAVANMKELKFPFIARDRDPESLEATKKNVMAAGLSHVIKIEEADALHAPPPECAGGLLLTNPPYGERLGLGGQKGMKSFFYALGESFLKWQGWRMGILAGNPAFESAFHMRPSKRTEFFNGPIECTLLQYGSMRALESKSIEERPQDADLAPPNEE
jgi:23S rRNA (guanine2445-N2)-methyltransferase / 23S rRNA (guanine2069-N7)-methyltransferase